MNAAALGIQSRDARRAREAAAKEAEDQFNLKNDTSRDAEGNYVYNPGSEGEYKARIWEKLGNETKAGSGRTGAPAPDARNLMTERRSQLKTFQNNMREQLVQGGYSWAEDHMSPEKKEKYLQDQKIAAQEKEMNALKGQMGATATDNAILDFAKNGDASVFQQALRNDPNLRQAWREQGVELISNVDFKNDTHLLDAVGLTKEYLSNPEVLELSKKNIFKVYDGDKFSLRSVGDVFAEVGTGNRVTDQTAKEMIDNVTKYNMALNGVSMEQEQQKVDAEKLNSETRASELDQKKNQSVIDETLNNRQATLAEAVAKETAEHNDETNINDDLDRDLRWAELNQKTDENQFKADNPELSPNEQQEKEIAASKKDIFAVSKSEDKFYAADFSDPKVVKSHSDAIGKYQRAIKYKSTDAQKQILTRIKSLTDLADSAKNISPDSTGFADKAIEGAKKLFSNDITGLVASTDHKWFRFSWLSMVAGKAMTATETANYDRTAGTLNHQIGPVLISSRSQVQQLITNLESIGSEMGPVLAHAKISPTLAKLYSIESAITERLDALNKGTKMTDAEKVIAEKHFKDTSKLTQDVEPVE